MKWKLAAIAVATVAGLTACGGSGQTSATTTAAATAATSTVPASVSAAKAVTATQVAEAAGGTSCQDMTPASGAVSTVTCTLPNGNSMNVAMFSQSSARDAYVISNLQQFPGDAGYWVEGRPGTRWAIQFTSIEGGQADAQSVAVRVNGIQMGGQPGQ